MADLTEIYERMKAVRRIAGPFPRRDIEERLGLIQDYTDLKKPFEGPKSRASHDLAERLAAGQASRPVRRTAGKPPEKKDEDEKKKRKKTGGKDRSEKGGFDRSADLND